MKSIERLRQHVEKVEEFVADTEARMSAGEGWLNAQLVSLEHHLDDLREQLDEAANRPAKSFSPHSREGGGLDVKVSSPPSGTLSLSNYG